MTLVLLLGASRAAYNESTAILLARLAGAAYNATGHEACLAAPFMGLGSLNMSTFRGYDDGEFLAFSVRERAVLSAAEEVRLYVSCRGTANTEQLLKDMTSVVATPFLTGTHAQCRAALYFHKGAMAHYDAIAAEVAAVQAAVPGPVRVFLTGHSLGGAMAALIALKLVALNVTAVAPVLYTFGAPRCGDWEFAQALNEAVPESYRVVYRADPVPHTPQCRTAAPDGGSSGGSALSLLGACTRASTDILKDPIWAFHHGTEVWYDGHGEWYEFGTGSGMPDIKQDARPPDDGHPLPKICNGEPFGEDRDCSNSVSNTLGGSLNALDHLRYFTPEDEDQKISEVCANKVLKTELWRKVARRSLGLLLGVPLSVAALLLFVCCIVKKVKRLREDREAAATAGGDSAGASSRCRGPLTRQGKKMVV